MGIISINPANGKKIREYPMHTARQVADKVASTHTAWLDWKNSDHATRALLLNKMAAVLRNKKKELAELLADEMGKPVTQGVLEVEKCAVCCEYYATNAKSFLTDVLIPTEAIKSFVSYRPLGVVLAIMPWNFPLWQVFRFLCPCLAAGNCGVLKHASNVPGSALAIEGIVRESGFPDNVFQTLLISGSAVEPVILNPLIKAVTITGSNKAGVQVAQTAGSVVKKVVLELGGSDAYVVLADADLELAAETCVKARFINSGQSCIAGKRFVVEASVVEEFTKLVSDRISKFKMGDPRDPSTEIGPQARKDLRDQLHDQVVRSIEKGATCLLGGKVPAGDHAYYPPTLLTNVKPGMAAYSEELFGAVATIITAKDEEDAIRIANDNEFGLGSAVFTKDVEKGERIAKQALDAGMSYVNAQVESDPRLPFGGVKNSGYGRELSFPGIHEFVNVKTVYVK
jgi:succinate-semialdehyde dehydrogenase / glutarate-semialdehyde dehydrogenase